MDCSRTGGKYVVCNGDVACEVTSPFSGGRFDIMRSRKSAERECHMTLKRHPGDFAIRKSMDKLTSEIKTWRSNLAQGAVTVEEFLEWLKKF